VGEGWSTTTRGAATLNRGVAHVSTTFVWVGSEGHPSTRETAPLRGGGMAPYVFFVFFFFFFFHVVVEGRSEVKNEKKIKELKVGFRN
jgi:hypothetical protein